MAKLLDIINKQENQLSSILSKDTIEKLTYRIQQEEESARIYEQCSLWFENEGLKNLARVYKTYSDEELNHARWSKEYLLNYGFTPQLRSLSQVTIPQSVDEILQLTLTHEQEITRQCNELAQFAFKNSDFMLLELAQKYLKEQNEEIGKAIDLLDRRKHTMDILLFDHYLED